MFTGIVIGQAEVIAVEKLPGLYRCTFELPAGSESSLQRGASVALDGVCLTATELAGRAITFDIMLETLERTTLSSLTIGSKVNLERAARFGDEIGGHLLSGHIDCIAEIVAIDRPENNVNLTFRLPARFAPYIFEKGYVALNGTSLTVTKVDRSAQTFAVSLIPETLRVTTFGNAVVGMRVNVEIDRQTQVIVDTVKAFLGSRQV